jgi:hypothetical protein
MIRFMSACVIYLIKDIYSVYYTPKGTLPIVTVTGSHQKICVFGTITIDCEQLFRQYDVFKQYAFLKYLKELQRKFRKLLLFIDRAARHRSSIMIGKHLEEDKMLLELITYPKAHLNIMWLKSAGDKEKMIYWYRNTKSSIII